MTEPGAEAPTVTDEPTVEPVAPEVSVPEVVGDVLAELTGAVPAVPAVVPGPRAVPHPPRPSPPVVRAPEPPAPETPAPETPAPETPAPAPPVADVADGPAPEPPTPPVAPATETPPPAAEATPAPTPAVPAPRSDDSPAPETYGRVEPDGTVWVRTSAGDVRVGQYQAGDVDQALAYFARKYTTLEVEVEVLEQRLSSGADVSIDDAQASVERLRTALVEPQVVGDIDGLRERIARLAPMLEARRALARAHRSAMREVARAERERIVSEAEQLADSTSWKTSGDRLKVLLDDWKAAAHVDRGVEQALWKRFSSARNSFDRRRRAYFAKLSSEQDEAKTVKETLLAEAERLSGSTDWAATATEMRRLMDRWKLAGRAGKTADEHLWQAFRSAQDRFYEARSAALAERDADLSDNLAAKQALANEAERILPVGDLATAKAGLRDIQERWEKIGHVPRGDRDRVEGQLRRVEQAIREAEEARWRRSNPEARARAQATVEQLEAAIAKLERQASAASAAGDDRALATARESIQARREWLVEAERALTEFGGR